MNGFTVGSNQSQVVSLNSELSRTYGGKGVDHSEPVSPARGHGEDFQRCVGHEAGVGIPELTLAVDQQTLGVLAGVHGQSSGEPFGGILVHPVAEEHHVGGEIEVVQVAVGVFGRWLTDGDAAVQTVHLLQAGVGVPEVGSCVSCYPLISGREKNILAVNVVCIQSCFPFFRHCFIAVSTNLNMVELGVLNGNLMSFVGSIFQEIWKFYKANSSSTEKIKTRTSP